MSESDPGALPHTEPLRGTEGADSAVSAADQPTSAPPADHQAVVAGDSGTDASRGQPGAMAQHGGDSSADNRALSERQASGDQAAGQGPSSQGSRAGAPLGSQTHATGMGDGQPQGSSQGLAGAQGSGGGAERGIEPDPGRGGGPQRR